MSVSASDVGVEARSGGVVLVVGVVVAVLGCGIEGVSVRGCVY